MENPIEYKPESAGALMTLKVPIIHPSNTVEEAIKILSHRDWDDSDTLYVISVHHQLIGTVPISRLLANHHSTLIETILDKPKVTVNPHTDQEKVVIAVISNDLETIPVVDDNQHFLGTILARQIIDVLHSEHLEDFLRSSGIRGKGSHIIELADSHLLAVVMSRLPWLIVGLLGGLGLSFLTSRFETSISENIALAFFIPVIAYIADSVGTQSETIFIRSLSILKIKPSTYIFKEFWVGTLIGLALGIFGGVGATLVSQSTSIGLIVGLSLFIASTLSSVLACITPLIFRAFGKDPALGSGPLTTVLQDALSLVIYFCIANFILGRV